jgi:CheY-like chemotaxis protein
MNQPLALLVYERLLPLGQLVNRLQDLGYRVRSLQDPAHLPMEAEREMPLLILLDVETRTTEACIAISAVHQAPSTSHIPMIAIAGTKNEAALEAARVAGAKMVVTDAAISLHLGPLLEQALQVE